MASIGQVVSHVASGGTSPGTEGSDAPRNSLLSELDTSYRILIEKYEALLQAREQQQEQQQHAGISQEGVVHGGEDGMSGPMSIMMTNSDTHKTELISKCQRCNTCACDLNPSIISNPDGSNTEELLDAETSSSGFSDGERQLISKGTQTGEDLSVSHAELLDDLTPTIHSKCLDLSSPVNPCDKRFQGTPEYKKLFQEIFTILKKSVDEKDAHSQPSKSEIVTEKTISASAPQVKEHKDIKSTEQSVIHPEEKTESKKSSQSDGTDDRHQKLSFGNTSHEEKVAGTLPRHSNKVHGECPNFDGKTETLLTNISDSDQCSVDLRPLRPDTLDLRSGDGSRPSSRQRRRRRQQQLAQLNTSLQQQQQQPDNGQSSHQSGHIGKQHHSHQRHQRRDRDGLLHHNYREQDDFPNLHPQHEGAPVNNSKSRMVYNSSHSGGHCEHRRSRKHRRSQQENAEQKHSGSDTEVKGKSVKKKINYPSVEVAKLRKLEMTYAEVLKNSVNRSFSARKY